MLLVLIQLCESDCIPTAAVRPPHQEPAPLNNHPIMPHASCRQQIKAESAHLMKLHQVCNSSQHKVSISEQRKIKGSEGFPKYGHREKWKKNTAGAQLQRKKFQMKETNKVWGEIGRNKSKDCMVNEDEHTGVGLAGQQAL